MDKIRNTPQPDSRSKIDRIERAPERRDRDQLKDEGQKFSDKLSEKEKEKPETPNSSSRSTGEKANLSAGDAILAQLMGQNLKPQTPVQNPMQQVAQMGPASPTQDISRVAEVIADRILVSDSQLTDQKMISIRIKNDILPQTEIRILSNGGNLKIEIQTGSADAFNFLGSQKESLVKHLQSTLSDSEISVSVDMEGAENDGQPGDGRSRNQRDIYEEMQEGDHA